MDESFGEFKKKMMKMSEVKRKQKRKCGVEVKLWNTKVSDPV